MKLVIPLLLGMCAPVCLLADNVVHPATPVLDRPTLISLGVQLPITGDDNFNASVTVRYRQTGAAAWSTGLPLWRVHPETVFGWTVAPNFAGTIFDLRPNTSYDIELHLTDPDGPVDQIFTLSGTTRPVPTDPPNPRLVNVNDDASLAQALNAAQPGDIIQLADGFYHGTLFIWASGTATNPIVIRGTTRDGTIIDGGNCDSCNVIEFYGDYIHLERLTLQNAQRAVRYQTDGSQGHVVRGIRVTNTIMGITSRINHLDFYICDNILQGRLQWPLTYFDDGGIHANDDGIMVAGFGHVVCHNTISGFGDAMKTEQDGARAVDFYGNDILWTYDNGVELDGSEGNVRLQRNRFTNNSAPLSIQPIYGGPAYMTRNIVINLRDEQMKFHGLSGSSLWTTPVPSGVLAYHNTFDKAGEGLLMNTPQPSHYFVIENNLFIGEQGTADTVNWGGPIDHGTFDYNAYYPNRMFIFNFYIPVDMSQYQNWTNWAALQLAGMVEPHGMLLQGPPFAKPIPMGPDYTTLMSPQDPQLLPGSMPVDRGIVLPNINDGYTGLGPDLGALEVGCPEPLYGPRPSGIDETNEPYGCVVVPPAVSVTVAPQNVQVYLGQTQQFTATVANASNTAVTWSLSPNVGSINASGLYIAPSVMAPTGSAPTGTQQAVNIQATSVADPTKTAMALVTLTIPPAVTVNVSPSSATLSAGATQKFTALVANSQNTAVTWSISPAIGSIAPDGTYSAPAVFPPGTTTVTIQATSVADPTKSATATVNLPAPVVSVTIAPASVTLALGQSQKFTANVVNTQNTAVTWSVSPAAGSIAADGTYTAPTAAPSVSVVTIQATSVADSTKTANATVNLSTPTISISIAPATATVTLGQIRKFTASVANTQNTAVNWSITSPVGSIAQDGTYTAPSTLPSTPIVIIQATSAADSTKSAIATVTLVAPTSVTVSVTPAAVALSPGGSQKFTANIANTQNTAVLWSISPAVGSIAQDGTYTAPAVVPPSSPTVTVQAVSMADPTKSATAIVSLPVLPVSVSVAPAIVALALGQTLKFTATVNNSTNSAVAWSISPNVGTIAQDGSYTAPAAVPASQTVTVYAISLADPTKIATAVITLPSGINLPVTVTVSPTYVTLNPGQTQKFVATVSNTPNTAVTWSVSPQLGTIASDGTYTAPAAPPSTPQPVTIVATSAADPTKSATAAVTLSVPATGLIPIFSTGVVSPGMVAADGSVDRHYIITSAPNGLGPNAYVANSNSAPFPYWVANGPNSKWISPSQNAGASQPYGSYSYQTTFDMTGLDPTTAKLTGFVSADAVMNIMLNGVRVARLIGGPYTLIPITIDSGFVTGLNKLEFDVVGLGGTTGLRVELSGAANTK